jgi:thiol-disulfide isomerase/thioredoxin
MIQPFVRAVVLTSLSMAGGHLVAADPVRATLIPSAERRTAEMIKLKDASGKTVDLASYRGHVVLVDFWATWCGGCKQELPWFQEFETKYGDRRFGVIAVSMNHEGWGVVKPFIESLKIGYKVVLDDGDTSKRYSFKEMPAAFLIDREGRLAAKYIGVVDRDNIESNIRLLLAEK